MDSLPRHQCLIYSGSPSAHLRAISLVIREKLRQGFRCVYLNSQPMVAGMCSYLAAANVGVEDEVRQANLILSSERPHLVDGQFNNEAMLEDLSTELRRALDDGYAGLWATGDMTWEMGLDRDSEKLVRYERQLEQLFLRHPQMGGVCQYHVDTLPPVFVAQAKRLHPAFFINETLSILNSDYASA
ncbi:hypothetical protein DYQ86_26745 [Acidobacteria bacterium AB60]|nr:hypothetical protein DYQ86_26745 [Acidobacteria bacterium AB60]